MPKKRGPKTDLLEALLKRVDGLEKRLKDEKKSGSESPTQDSGSAILEDQPNGDAHPSKRLHLDTDLEVPAEASALYSPSPTR